MTLPNLWPALRDQLVTSSVATSSLHAQPLPVTCYLLPITSQRETARGGFTLIETALALLAIGLGLLALFGLGRLGLTTSKESENDTRCAQMADAVFETLREVNTRFVDNARTNIASDASALWLQQWSSAVTTPKQIPFPPVANMMSRSDKLYLTFSIEDNSQTTSAAYDPDKLSLSDWNPRYILYFGTHSEESYVAEGLNFLAIMLFIFPDGDTSSSDYRLYHTTLSNPGGMP